MTTIWVADFVPCSYRNIFLFQNRETFVDIHLPTSGDGIKDRSEKLANSWGKNKKLKNQPPPALGMKEELYFVLDLANSFAAPQHFTINFQKGKNLPPLARFLHCSDCYVVFIVVFIVDAVSVAVPVAVALVVLVLVVVLHVHVDQFCCFLRVFLFC